MSHRSFPIGTPFSHQNRQSFTLAKPNVTSLLALMNIKRVKSRGVGRNFKEWAAQCRQARQRLLARFACGPYNRLKSLFTAVNATRSATRILLRSRGLEPKKFFLHKNCHSSVACYRGGLGA